MRSYNGFSAQQRSRGGRWFLEELRAGRRHVAAACQACGQTAGVRGHSEDYSEPFGPHIGRFSLCNRCHLMLHSRFTAPAAFEEYVRELEAGWRFPPARTYDVIRRYLRTYAQLRLELDGREPRHEGGGDPGLLRRMAAGEYAPQRASEKPGASAQLPY